MKEPEIIRPVFLFNLLIDLDYGVLQYVRTLELYKDAQMFHQYFFGLTPREIKTELNKREDRNPLSILALDYTRDKEFLDNLYDKCMTTNYLEVQKRAVRTSCVELVKKLADTQAAKPIVVYSNEYQKRYYDILFNDCLSDTLELVSEEELGNIKYDTIYVKYVDDLLNKFLIKGGNIYIADLKTNLEVNRNQRWMPKGSLLYGISNVVHLFNIYPIEDDAYNYYFEEEIDKDEK